MFILPHGPPESYEGHEWFVALVVLVGLYFAVRSFMIPAKSGCCIMSWRRRSTLVISLSYSGVPRHSDRHQIEFCMFGVLRICRMRTGQNLVPQHFWISHHRLGDTSEMARFVGTKVEFGADSDEFVLNLDTRELPLINADLTSTMSSPGLSFSKRKYASVAS